MTDGVKKTETLAGLDPISGNVARGGNAPGTMSNFRIRRKSFQVLCSPFSGLQR
jgi:hypothetical protein